MVTKMEPKSEEMLLTYRRRKWISEQPPVFEQVFDDLQMQVLLQVAGYQLLDGRVARPRQVADFVGVCLEAAGWLVQGFAAALLMQITSASQGWQSMVIGSKVDKINKSILGNQSQNQEGNEGFRDTNILCSI
ncbi:uncharacterized protein LOC127129864 isoform X1 [Lathyrus oleraceus]|uniref:uncharacterized protein LOC127129864 isoform X1 n=1 Tax=Pisum sativum TaxID=3888 RepID=UPI0021CE8B93|nr:uncharacterized protein LOC127129864 isoform X1 [Pisum sativum]